MLFVACTGTYEEYIGKVAKTIVHLISSNRSGIFATLGALMFAWIIANWKNINIANTPVQLTILTMMGFYASLIRFFHEGPVGGATSTIYAMATLVPLALALPAALNSRERMVLALRLIAAAGALYVFMVAVQFFVNRGVMLRPPQARFSGLSGNPQTVAITFSVFSLVALWLLLRLFWAALLGASLIILLWTGSRTGVGMTAIGFSFAFYRRFGKLIFLAPVAIVVAYITYGYLAGQGVEFVADRLVSTENTREKSWRVQWTMFTSSPIIGVGVDATKSENSYLYALAAFGIGMGAFVVLLVLVSAVVCLKLFLNRRYLPNEYKSLCDLTLAYNALYFAGGFLEGYMLARVGSHLIFMAVFAAIASTLLRLAAEQRSLAPVDALPEYNPDALANYTEYCGSYGDDQSLPHPA
jgi:hypothetical protein